MKVLIVSQYFWPEGFRINDVVQSLVSKGVDVDVLTGKPNYPVGAIFPGYRFTGRQLESWSGALVHRVPLFPRGARSSLRLALNYLSFVVMGIVWGPWMLRGRSYDAILVYAPSPILQAIPAIYLRWLKQCKTMIWVQDLWPDSLAATGYVRNRSILWLVERVVRFIYRRVDLLLVQSQAFIEPVSALAGNTPVKYYPNSGDDRFAVPAQVVAPDVLGLKDGFCILFAGNIGSAQAVEVIVDAATLLKDHDGIQFLVLGDGSRRDWMLLEQQSRGLDNLLLPGRFPVETMPAFMQNASALLVTLADQEIFAATVPSKVQAYLAAGRPILACLNGEGARLVDQAAAGLSVPAQDAKALADAVLQLYRMSAEQRNEIGANGRRYFKAHFDHNMLMDELLVHLNSVIADRKSK